MKKYLFLESTPIGDRRAILFSPSGHPGDVSYLVGHSLPDARSEALIAEMCTAYNVQRDMNRIATAEALGYHTGVTGE